MSFMISSCFTSSQEFRESWSIYVQEIVIVKIIDVRYSHTCTKIGIKCLMLFKCKNREARCDIMVFYKMIHGYDEKIVVKSISLQKKLSICITLAQYLL